MSDKILNEIDMPEEMFKLGVKKPSDITPIKVIEKLEEGSIDFNMNSRGGKVNLDFVVEGKRFDLHFGDGYEKPVTYILSNDKVGNKERYSYSGGEFFSLDRETAKFTDDGLKPVLDEILKKSDSEIQDIFKHDMAYDDSQPDKSLSSISEYLTTKREKEIMERYESLRVKGLGEKAAISEIGVENEKETSLIKEYEKVRKVAFEKNQGKRLDSKIITSLQEEAIKRTISASIAQDLKRTLEEKRVLREGIERNGKPDRPGKGKGRGM